MKMQVSTNKYPANNLVVILSKRPIKGSDPLIGVFDKIIAENPM